MILTPSVQKRLNSNKINTNLFPDRTHYSQTSRRRITMKLSPSVPGISLHTSVVVRSRQIFCRSFSNRIQHFQCRSTSSELRTQSITPAEIRTLPIIFPTKTLSRTTPLVVVLTRCLTWPAQPMLSSIRSWVGVRVVTGIFSRNWETTPAISQVINHQYTDPVPSSTAPESKVSVVVFFTINQ